MKKPKTHRIRNPWLRIPLKTLMWICIVILVLPVLVYIPPVQTLLKNAACSIVSSSTGMKVSIDRFRLTFPLDVALDGVSIVEASGDTMVSARTAIADVKLLPLFHLDVRLNALRLQDGYYRLLSEDSSMVMKIRAGLVDVDGRSSFNLKTSHLDLNKARIKDGDISLYMNVWKQKKEPQDTAKTQMLITAHELKLQNTRFAMSMLPLIDTLVFETKNLDLRDGKVDLTNSIINAKSLVAADGKFVYTTPTAEWIKAHPAPVDTMPSTAPPFTITADSVALDNFDVLYATVGAKPQPGFDAAYISLSEVSASVKDFYNCEANLRLPITRLMGKERCGLQITDAQGLMTIDSLGLAFQDLIVHTPLSRLNGSATLPYAVMELDPSTPFSANLEGSLGFGDIVAFMPSLGEYTRLLAPASRASLLLDAVGTLASLNLRKVQVDVPDILHLDLFGTLDNPLKPERLGADLTFDASLMNPRVADRMLAMGDVNVPRFRLTGTASISGSTYATDFELRSDAGNLDATGSVVMTSESYTADVKAMHLNVGHIMPSLGIGEITAVLKAHGNSFDFTGRGANSDIDLSITSLGYGSHVFRDINGTVGLHGGLYNVDLNSGDPDALLSVQGSGSVAPDDYSVDLTARIDKLDLQALGMSETLNNGSGVIYVSGTASPNRWLYDMNLRLDDFSWNLPDQAVSLPGGVEARLLATADYTNGAIEADGMHLQFDGSEGLKSLMDKFLATSDFMTKQLAQKHIDIEELERKLPAFSMDLAVSGRGIPGEVLHNMGYAIDTLSMRVSNVDSLLNANARLLGLNTGTMKIDTIGLDLKRRGYLMDYFVHMGNSAGNMPEFAQVDLNGYMGGNRLSAYLRQKNEQGETGYRLGFTAALQDSTVTVRFTPLKATIAYMPWTFNVDNYIDYTIGQKNPLNANLMGSSAGSSILLKTEIAEDGIKEQHMNLTNIRIQDFMGMDITNETPLQATVNADLRLRYRGTALMGSGTADITDIVYDGTKIDPLSASFDAGLDFAGDTQARIGLKVNGAEALVISGLMKNDGSNHNDFALDLTDFPLSVANAFLPKDMLSLEGALSGHMAMNGELTDPRLNGDIVCKNVAVFIPMMGSRLHFGSEPVTVKDNVITFDNFQVTGQNDNPLVLAGVVDATKFSNIKCNLKIDGDNFQLVGNNEKARSDIYGKLFMNLHATASGPLNLFDVNGTLTVLNTTDVFYSMASSAAALGQTNADDVVKFVNFNDTTQVAHSDTVVSPLAMRIRAGLTIQPGTKVTVNLSGNKTDRVVVNPSGTLNYFQNFMGDMTLNGILNLGEGSARYALPVVGEKSFTLSQGSYIQWNGPIMNPVLNINAVDNMKVNVTDNGSSRLVNFAVLLDVGGTLNGPKVTFDLQADGDMSISNELSSMTPDQRSQQAMNLLLYGQYTGPNTRTSASNIGENALYGFLTSQLNSWAANHVKGVDLNFGIDQYDQTTDGRTSTATSYSYQVSKSLLNNKFKIVVGGNYSTDQSADDNFAENLLSDVSFEYMLKQTNNLTMLVKLFRQYNYESVLEGQVVETGVGFVMKRRLSDLKRFFRVRWRRRKAATPTATEAVLPKDSVVTTSPKDSTTHE